MNSPRQVSARAPQKRVAGGLVLLAASALIAAWWLGEGSEQSTHGTEAGAHRDAPPSVATRGAGAAPHRSPAEVSTGDDPDVQAASVLVIATSGDPVVGLSISLDAAGDEEEPGVARTDAKGVTEIPKPLLGRLCEGRLALDDPNWRPLSFGSIRHAESGASLALVVAGAAPRSIRLVDDQARTIAGYVRVTLLAENLRALQEHRYSEVCDFPLSHQSFDVAESGSLLMDHFPADPATVVTGSSRGFRVTVHDPESLERASNTIVLDKGPTRRVSGLVQDAAGGPVPGATVALSQQWTTSDSEGRFELDMDYVGIDSSLTARSEHAGIGWIPGLGRELLSGNHPGNGLVVTLSPADLSVEGRVEGTVDRAFRDVEVYLLRGTSARGDSPRCAEFSRLGKWGSPFERPDREGRFRISGLVDREYTLVLIERSTLLYKEFGPFAAGTSSIVLEVEPDDYLREIKGRVVDMNGVSVPYAEVSAFPGARSSRFFQSRPPWTLTRRADEDGRFSFELLGADHVRVRSPQGRGSYPVRLFGTTRVEELVVDLDCDFTFVNGKLGFDSFRIRDQAGKDLQVVVAVGDGAKNSGTLHTLDLESNWAVRGTTSQTARELALFIDDVEVATVPLELDPKNVVRIELP